MSYPKPNKFGIYKNPIIFSPFGFSHGADSYPIVPPNQTQMKFMSNAPLILMNGKNLILTDE